MGVKGVYESFLNLQKGTFRVIRELEPVNRIRTWECVCKCGHLKSCKSRQLKSRARLMCTADCPYTPTSQKFYVTWYQMIARCHDPRKKGYFRYGGRGIYVCDKWRFNYFVFHKWAEKRWKPGLSLDRRNNDGPYSPSNCRFVNILVQANNRRNNTKIKIDGKTKGLNEWCRVYNINASTVCQRIKYGWPLLKALQTPVKKRA